MELTRETPAPGLVVWQPRRGYRYGVEVYALADLALTIREAAAPRPGAVAPAHIADLGAGSGVLTLLLATLGHEVWAVERDPRWLPLLRRSVADSGLLDRVHLVEADVRGLTHDDLPPLDLVVTNPPWFDPAAGPRSPDPWKAAARTALHGGPTDFFAAGLRVAPWLVTVGPADAPLPSPPFLTRALGRRRLAALGADPRPAALDEPAPDPYRRWRPPVPGFDI